jgi:hypothetical protein
MQMKDGFAELIGVAVVTLALVGIIVSSIQ